MTMTNEQIQARMDYLMAEVEKCDAAIAMSQTAYATQGYERQADALLAERRALRQELKARRA